MLWHPVGYETSMQDMVKPLKLRDTVPILLGSKPK